jgi:glutaredoxin
MTISKLKLFFTPMCPKCPKIKQYLETKDIEKELIDAATPDGLKKAKEYGVNTVPTVLFFDVNNTLLSQAGSLEEVKRTLENQTLV